MKAIIKEHRCAFTYENVNHIKIDNDANTCTINYQDENDEEHEEFGSMGPDFSLQLIQDKEKEE